MFLLTQYDTVTTRCLLKKSFCWKNNLKCTFERKSKALNRRCEASPNLDLVSLGEELLEPEEPQQAQSRRRNLQTGQGRWRANPARPRDVTRQDCLLTNWRTAKPGRWVRPEVRRVLLGIWPQGLSSEPQVGLMPEGSDVKGT